MTRLSAEQTKQFWARGFWSSKAAPKVASPNCGEGVRGKPSLTARLKSDVIELPPNYQDDSFFTVQGQETAIG